jgi:hypothetical protein
LPQHTDLAVVHGVTHNDAGKYDNQSNDLEHVVDEIGWGTAVRDTPARSVSTNCARKLSAGWP